MQARAKLMRKFARLKNGIAGKTKRLVAEIDGDLNLAREGEVQAAQARADEKLEKRDHGTDGVLGKLNHLT
jgi:soluble cytochrome b562